MFIHIVIYTVIYSGYKAVSLLPFLGEKHTCILFAISICVAKFNRIIYICYEYMLFNRKFLRTICI